MIVGKISAIVLLTIISSTSMAADFKGSQAHFQGDKLVDDRLAVAITADANDFIYQWEASHDYDPSAALEKIAAATLLINAADDERNPPETGITEAALKRIRNARLHLIPASAQTRGHSTTGNASFSVQPLRELLQTAPQRTM